MALSKRQKVEHSLAQEQYNREMEIENAANASSAGHSDEVIIGFGVEADEDECESEDDDDAKDINEAIDADAVDTRFFDCGVDTDTTTNDNDFSDEYAGAKKVPSAPPHGMVGTSKSARSYTSRALAPVTNSPPRKKKSQPSQRQSSGKENLGNDVKKPRAVSLSPEDNRMSFFSMRTATRHQRR